MTHPPLDYLISGYVYGLFTAAIAYHTGALAKETWVRWRRRRFSVASPASDEAQDMGGMENQLSFEDALEKRDDVLAEVADDNAGWMAEAIRACAALPNGEVGTGEDVRAALLERGLRSPRHPNVWGALFNTLTRRGVLVATGEMRPMRSKSSNGRKTSVYIKAEPEMAT